MRDGEGGEAEVRLRLAAAGRKEQQVAQLAIGVCLVRHPREIEQDKGELERPPRRAQRRVAAARAQRVGDRAIADLERGARPVVLRQQRDPGGDPLARLPLRIDQRRGGARALGRVGDVGRGQILLGDPARIFGDQRHQRGVKRTSVLACKGREPVHTEFDAGDLGRHRPLHRGGRQVRGTDPPYDALGVDAVLSRAAQADGVSGGVAVMEVGELIVPIVARDPRQIVLRQEAGGARQRDTHLIGIGQVAVAPADLHPLVDQKHGQDAHLAHRAARARQAERARADADLQRAAGSGGGARIGDEDGDQAVGDAGDPQRQRPLVRDPSPADGRAGQLAAALQQVGRQRRFGDVIAPADRRLHRLDIGIEHRRQPDRTRQKPPSRRRRLRLVVVARRAARALRLRLGKEAVAFVIVGRVACRLRHDAGWRDEAGEVPARRALARGQPLCREIGVLRTARPDQVAPQPPHQFSAHPVCVHNRFSATARVSLSLSNRASSSSRNAAGQCSRPW